ncbi:aldo/keto reductase [Naasia sp. SYSU D00948]|uniref:aldo/keto reductase n=1 Tax=Naasia sp. SYSU D00948 TaxID=2817379 RepID=UPI0027DC7B5D|nr:aldo/keto reductase [Naasia sp. SYSU D00948]
MNAGSTPPVDLRPLGGTGIDVSPITVGTSFLGAGTEPGSAGEERAVALATAMLQGPYALVDTSNNYAAGRSEAVLGRALPAAAPGRFVVTKTDRDATGRFDRDRVRRSFDESCERLGVDRVPLLHLHDPFSITFEEAMAPGGAVQGMLELRDEGLAGAIGIAAGPLEMVRRYVETGCFDAMLTHNRFTLVDRSAVPLIETARERGMGVFNAAPFGGGLLARGAASGGTYAYLPSPPELLDWVARAEQVCARHGVDLRTAALHFSLRSPLIDSTVVGVGSIEHFAALEVMRTVRVPEELWADLDGLGPAPSTTTD